MVAHGRIRKAARQATTQAKDGTQARAIGKAWETERAKTWAGTGMVSPKNDKDRTNRTSKTPEGWSATFRVQGLVFVCFLRRFTYLVWMSFGDDW